MSGIRTLTLIQTGMTSKRLEHKIYNHSYFPADSMIQTVSFSVLRDFLFGRFSIQIKCRIHCVEFKLKRNWINIKLICMFLIIFLLFYAFFDSIVFQYAVWPSNPSNVIQLLLKIIEIFNSYCRLEILLPNTKGANYLFCGAHRGRYKEGFLLKFSIYFGRIRLKN